jgi:hypothetical protein
MTNILIKRIFNLKNENNDLARI